MAHKRSSRRRTSSKNGCLSGCLSAIFGLIGALIKALVAVIAGLVQLLASIVKWLSQKKITVPVGEGYQVSGLLVSLFLCFLCMCGSMTCVWTDRQLRAIGILPTYTPRPTATNTPRPTETSTPTDTLTPLPLPTETPLPIDTPTPSRLTAKVIAPTLNVRTGPDTAYPTVGQLSLDDSIEVVGRNAASDWLQIVYPADSDGRAWIAAAYAELTGSLATVPEVSAPTPMPPTATPMPIDTPNGPHIVQSLSEFEESQFCRAYHCRPGDSWDLRSGGINNTYDIDVSPEVTIEITTLEERPVDFGVMFYYRQKLDSEDLQLVFLFLSSIYPGIEVDSSIKNFIEQNVEIDVFQICEANSIPFGSMRIWAGKIIQQTVSVGEGCP